MNWTHIYKKYRGLWVALKEDCKTVVASGKTAREALRKSEKRGIPDPYLNYVLKNLLLLPRNSIFMASTSRSGVLRSIVRYCMPFEESNMFLPNISLVR